LTAPKPGDRVKVTYEGVVADVSGVWMRVIAPLSGGTETVSVPKRATVEVLASPVYVNSDTTERLPGDIVRDRHGVIWARTAGQVWRNAVAGIDYRGAEIDPNGGNLTLLVRDGQVVQP
jgi:hypothetical protein